MDLASRSLFFVFRIGFGVDPSLNFGVARTVIAEGRSHDFFQMHCRGWIASVAMLGRGQLLQIFLPIMWVDLVIFSFFGVFDRKITKMKSWRLYCLIKAHEKNISRNYGN